MIKACQDIQKKHAALSRFVVHILLILAIYDLGVEILIRLKHLHQIPPAVTTAVVVLVFGLIFFRMIKKMGYPLREFGFNLDNLKKNVLESLAWTLGFCAFLLLVKWLVITQVKLYESWPLLYHPKPQDLWFQTVAAVVYMLFAFFQCFIFHGALQSSLMNLLAQPRAVPLSVLITTFVFGAFHIDMHFTFALLTLIPGVMWSIMYARQRSLVGVTISHALVGVWAMWGLDFYQMLNLAFARLAHSPGAF